MHPRYYEEFIAATNELESERLMKGRQVLCLSFGGTVLARNRKQLWTNHLSAGWPWRLLFSSGASLTLFMSYTHVVSSSYTSIWIRTCYSALQRGDAMTFRNIPSHLRPRKRCLMIQMSWKDFSRTECSTLQKLELGILPESTTMVFAQTSCHG